MRSVSKKKLIVGTAKKSSDLDNETERLVSGQWSVSDKCLNVTEAELIELH